MAKPPLTLSSLPKYKCCDHCKVAYCPDWAGHYAPCPDKNCHVGRDLIEKTGG